jgi:parallel beta-helix repeat protein
METQRERTRIVMCLLALAGLVGFAITAGGGSLEQAALLAPVKKTLDDVEPRTPISSLPYTISAAGSYYLTGNLTADANGILVDANNVTIDLAGFSMIGPGSGTSYGVYMNGRRNVEIRNGTVRGFTGAYPLGGGICEDTGTGHRVIGVRAVSNGRGIVLRGSGHLVKDCTIVENTSFGIHVGQACTVTGNTCYANHNRGITTYSNCTVTGNTCCDNGNQGILCEGSGGSTVTGNTCRGNWVGIQVLDGCTVTGNTARKNKHSGIFVRMGSLVRNNTLRDNEKYNIYVEQPGNAIEENLVTNSPDGIYFNSGGNFFSNNRASGNVSDYSNHEGNTDGGGNYSFRMKKKMEKRGTTGRLKLPRDS